MHFPRKVYFMENHTVYFMATLTQFETIGAGKLFICVNATECENKNAKNSDSVQCWWQYNAYLCAILGISGAILMKAISWVCSLSQKSRRVVAKKINISRVKKGKQKKNPMVNKTW